MPLHSSWVSGTGLPLPPASSPVRNSQHQCGPRVLPWLGAPAEPVLVGAGAAALPQPRASLTFLKCTDSPCTCARWVTLSAYKMQEKLGVFVSVLHRQGREVSAWDGAWLGCQGHRQLRGGEQEGTVKQGTEAGVRGTLVTSLRTRRGRRTGAFHWFIQILHPCRMLQELHAVAWLLQLVPWPFQLCHGIAVWPCSPCPCQHAGGSGAGTHPCPQVPQGLSRHR